MERVLDTMALHKPFTDSIREDPKKLKHYYETDWMKDFESDEKGEPVVSIAPSSLLMLLSPTRVIRPVRFVMIIRSELPLKPEHIILEITESAVIRDKGRVDSIIHQLNNAGFEYASDDFGTGKSNYSYVHEFPFSIIKIDNRSLWAAKKIPLIVPLSRICSGWQKI